MQQDRSGWLGWADPLSKLRDIALIASGAIYVAGYLSRAIHAWDHNLGALPGAQFEYFVAGFVLLLPPTVLALLAWFIWRGLKRLVKWADGHKVRQKRIGSVLGGSVIAGLGLVFLNQIEYLAARAPLMDIAVWTIVGGVGLSVAYSAAGGTIPGDSDAAAAKSARADKRETSRRGWSPLKAVLMVTGWVGQLFSWLMALNLALLVLLVVLLMPMLGSLALRYVPQELGGMSPKCATFDLAEGSLSPPMHAALVESGSAAKVLRSVPLEVYSSSEPWLVKVPRQAVRSTTYRLNKEAVHSVTWCRWPA